MYFFHSEKTDSASSHPTLRNAVQDVARETHGCLHTDCIHRPTDCRKLHNRLDRCIVVFPVRWLKDVDSRLDWYIHDCPYRCADWRTVRTPRMMSVCLGQRPVLVTRHTGTLTAGSLQPTGLIYIYILYTWLSRQARWLQEVYSRQDWYIYIYYIHGCLDRHADCRKLYSRLHWYIHDCLYTEANIGQACGAGTTDQCVAGAATCPASGTLLCACPAGTHVAKADNTGCCKLTTITTTATPI